jgi:hypothetical protein
MNEWAHQLVLLNWPSIISFSSVMYVHHLMSIFHTCAMPHIIASSQLCACICAWETHTHIYINRMCVRIDSMMEPVFFSSFSIHLYMYIAGMSTKWWIELINKEKEKKRDGIIEINKKKFPLLLFDDYETLLKNSIDLILSFFFSNMKPIISVYTFNKTSTHCWFK